MARVNLRISLCPTQDYQILKGDSRIVLLNLLPNSIQCIVTSPPYYKCRLYLNSDELGQEDLPSQYIANLCDILESAKIPLKNNGLLWVVIGDSKAKKNHPDIGCFKGEFIGIPWLFAFEMRRRGWRIQQEAIWAKKNPIPTSSNKMLTPCHEIVFMLSLNKDFYFDPTKITIDSKTDLKGEMPPIGGYKLGGGINSAYSGNTPPATGKTRRRDVFFLPTSRLPEAHFAPFPEDLIEPLIIASSQERDLVLDIFCGSGTTGIVARRNNRRFVGIDCHPDYVEMAVRRIEAS